MMKLLKRISWKLSMNLSRPMSSKLNKVYNNAEEAIKGIGDHSTLLFGGFGLCGVPENLIAAIQNKGAKNLTCISNEAGTDGFGLDLLLHSHQVKRMVISFIGSNKLLEKLYLNGEVEIELVPQGTLAERLRAGGAGIPAFYTPSGVGTIVQHGGLPIKYNRDKSIELTSKPKETRDFNDREYLLEEAINGDFALIKAWKGDKFGNLVCRSTAQNFNTDCAKAAKITIAEVEEIVEPGEIKPEEVHIPAIYVDRIVKRVNYDNRIEHLIFSGCKSEDAAKERIAKRVALEFKDGMYLNLGIGIPTLASNFIPDNINVEIQSENGLLGMGPYPEPGHQDADLINAGKETVSYIPGSSAFSSSESFAMIRGGHLQLTVLGALQVSEGGDLANWVIPGKLVMGMGGAMDLVSSNSRVIVAMKHTTKAGAAKILNKCTLPLTGEKVVDLIITDLGVFEVNIDGLLLTEIAEGVNIEKIRYKTEASFKISPNLKIMSQ